jgi:hypothetical protein
MTDDKLDEVLRYGQQLSNIAFNMEQREGLPLADIRAMESARKGWDDALHAWKAARLAQAPAEPAARLLQAAEELVPDMPTSKFLVVGRMVGGPLYWGTSSWPIDRALASGQEQT